MIYPRFSMKYLAFTQYFKPSHQAVDIPRSVTVNGIKNQMANEYIYMAHQGKILRNVKGSSYGWYVEYEYIDGKDKWVFRSGHMDTKSPLIVGKTYPMGTVIGKCGKLGIGSTGYHDHFIVIKNGVRQDPLTACYAYKDWNIQGSKEYTKLNWYDPEEVEEQEPEDNKKYVQLKSAVWCRRGIGFKNPKYKVIPKNTKCELIMKNAGKSNGYNWDKIIYNKEIVYLPNKWNIYL